jgi:hypothetical protein
LQLTLWYGLAQFTSALTTEGAVTVTAVFIIIVSLMGMGVVFMFASIGKPREPISRAPAIANAIVTALYIAAITWFYAV